MLWIVPEFRPRISDAMAMRARIQYTALSIWNRTRTSFGHVPTRSVNTTNLFWNWTSNIWTQIRNIARDSWRWSSTGAQIVWGWVGLAWRSLINVWTTSRLVTTSVWRRFRRLAETITFSLTANFLAAIAFAIGHHLFYQSLVNTVPPSGDMGIPGFLQNASGQSYNIAIGTLLATISAALLGVSIKTTHEQLSWSAAKAKPTDLKTLDQLFLRSIWSLGLWHRYFGSEVLALLLW